MAREHAEHGGLSFVHPFDDREVIAGQGGLGVELLDQAPELARVLVPVGGGRAGQRGRDRAASPSGRKGSR